METMGLITKIDDLNLEVEDGQEPKSSQQLVFDMVKSILIHDNLGEEDRRKYGKICDAFEKAVAEKATTIKLEDAWAKLIRKQRSKAKFIPNTLSMRVEALIDDIAPEKKSEENTE